MDCHEVSERQTRWKIEKNQIHMETSILSNDRKQEKILKQGKQKWKKSGFTMEMR